MRCPFETCYRRSTCARDGDWRGCWAIEAPAAARPEKPVPARPATAPPGSTRFASRERSLSAARQVRSWLRDWCGADRLSEATGMPRSSLYRAARNYGQSSMSLENCRRVEDAARRGIEPRERGMCSKAEARALALAVSQGRDTGLPRAVEEQAARGGLVKMEDYEAAAMRLGLERGIARLRDRHGD